MNFIFPSIHVYHYMDIMFEKMLPPPKILYVQKRYSTVPMQILEQFSVVTVQFLATRSTILTTWTSRFKPTDYIDTGLRYMKKWSSIMNRVGDLYTWRNMQLVTFLNEFWYFSVKRLFIVKALASGLGSWIKFGFTFHVIVGHVAKG